MLKHKNIESFLPVFNGFYGTHFEPDEESTIESPYTWDDYEFDYVGYRTNVSLACCDAIENKLNDIGIKGVTIKYQNLSSPREYNFANDSINVKYKLTDTAVKAINSYLIDNKEAFTTYIKNRYTSRDGFMSWHSNDANDWLNDKLSDKKELSHAFGAVLEFIFENEGYEAYNLYEDITDIGDVWLNGWLKEGVTD
jgi:hypothetical protein